MKIQPFKAQLRADLEQICEENGWVYDNAKHRGMAFENWCFGLLQERYQSSDNDPEESINRGDDFEIDICFESKETDEVYLVQCKHPKIAASDPISESEVKSFFETYRLLKDKRYLEERNSKNLKIKDLEGEFPYWLKKSFLSLLFS